MTSSNSALPKELRSRLLRTVPLLKRWAAQLERTSHSIASELCIPNPTLYQAIIPELLNIYNAAVNQPEFPSNLLLYYNQHGNPDPELNLTEVEAHALKLTFERELERKPEQLTQRYYTNPNTGEPQQTSVSRRTGSSQRFLILAQMQNLPRISMSDFFPGIRAVLYDADVFSKIA